MNPSNAQFEYFSNDNYTLPPELLVDYYQSTAIGVDFPGPTNALLCNNDKWQFKRLKESEILKIHTHLDFEVIIDDEFSKIGQTGYRIGAYYNHELVLWTEPMKKSHSFSYDLDGAMYDMNKDVGWTFFFKRTDMFTENDEDACTSGFHSGELIVKIYAK